MFGIYRFMLCMGVVYFHFGGGYDRDTSGWLSVYGFFCVSGYLMALVLDKSYSKLDFGVGRFYLNRMLRLYPLLCVYLGLAIYSRGIKPSLGMIGDHLIFGARWSLSPVGLFSTYPAPLGQNWSLACEAFFYLLAPVLFFIHIRFPFVCWLIAFSSIAYAVILKCFYGIAFQSTSYFNGLVSLAWFITGMEMYVRRDAWKQFSPGKSSTCVIFGLVAWAAFAHRGANFDWWLFFGVCLMPALTFAIAGIKSTGRWRKVDTLIGDLTYGVFLNHYLVADHLVPSLQFIGRQGGPQITLGAPGTASFGIALAVAATLVSALTYVVIELPINRIRDSLKANKLATCENLKSMVDIRSARAA